MKHNLRRTLCFSLALCLCLALFAMAPLSASAETGIGKVLIQTGNGGTTPVVWMELQYLPTNTSTAGVTITSAQWYTVGGSPVGARFEDQTAVYLQVRVAANEGYLFTDDVMCFINGSQATCVRESETSLLITSHSYTPEIWAAVVYKHPTGETVDPGGWASFVTSGGYVQDFEWCLMTPDKQHRFTLKEAREECQVVSRDPLIPKAFSQVQTEGDFKEGLVMRNIPAELDGYYVYCRLYSYNRITWANTNPARITVNQPSPTPEPTPEPTPTPTPSPSPSPSPSPTPSPAPSPSPSPSATPAPTESPEPSPEQHEHQPADVWTWDESFHWHACADCEEQLDKAEHALTWTETSPAALGLAGEEEGVCSVCGYKTTREIPALEPEDSAEGFDATLGVSADTFRLFVLGVFGAIGVGLVALIVGGIVHASKKRR